MSDKREIIKRLTETVRNAYPPSEEGTIKEISDWKEFIDKLGGELVENEGLFYDARISKVNNDTNPKFQIQYSPYQPNTRLNFSIAHELGHLFLHMLYRIDENYWKEIPTGQSYDRNGSSEIENQANLFAAEFLMPENIYRTKLEETREGNYYYIRPVAEYFGVSVEAASNRGKWLGILQW